MRMGAFEPCIRVGPTVIHQWSASGTLVGIRVKPPLRPSMTEFGMAHLMRRISAKFRACDGTNHSEIFVRARAIGTADSGDWRNYPP